MDLHELKLCSQDKTADKQRKKEGLRAAIVGISLNLSLAVAKLIAGYLSGSLAISADGWNNVSDAFSSIVTLLSFVLGSKPADKEHPFGHARIEYIASSIIAFGMLLVGVSLAHQSIKRIIQPEPLDLGILSFLALALSITVKTFLYFFYTARARRLGSPVMRASAQDSMADTIATTAVLLSTILFAVWGINIDGIAGLIVSIFILWSAVNIIRQMSSRLMGGPPSKELEEHICQEIINSDQRIVGVHDLLVHDYGPGKIHASAHVEIDSRLSFITAHLLLDKIERKFFDDYGLEIVLHPDPSTLNDPSGIALAKLLQKTGKSIDNKTDVHDIQQYDTSNGKVLSFEVLLPDKLTISDDNVRAIFRTALAEDYSEYTALIAIERAYQTTSLK